MMNRDNPDSAVAPWVILLLVVLGLFITLIPLPKSGTGGVAMANIPPPNHWEAGAGPTGMTLTFNGQPIAPSRIFLAYVPTYTTWNEYGLGTRWDDNDYDSLYRGFTFLDSYPDTNWQRSGDIMTVPTAGPGDYTVIAEWLDNNIAPSSPSPDAGSNDDPDGVGILRDTLVTLYKIENIASVSFVSRNTDLKLNVHDNDWGDTDTTDTLVPEWKASAGRNSPSCHTKDTTLTVAVEVIVKPAGLNFEITGNGPEDYVDFHGTGLQSTGTTQTVELTANAAIPSYVTTLEKSIEWSIKLTNPEPDVPQNIGTSGPHMIYVTFGVPSGSLVTETRIRFVVRAAEGIGGGQNNDPEDCADAVFNHLTGSYDLNGLMWGPDPIWLLHNSSQTSQCPGLADFVNKHFQMLGLGTGEIRFCYAKPDGTYDYSTSPVGTQWRFFPIPNHPTPTTHDDQYDAERLMHVDDNGDGNAYEATCFFNNKYYAIGMGDGIFTSYAAVVQEFPSIEWQYRTNNPTPPPDYLFHECTELPWTEQ